MQTVKGAQFLNITFLFVLFTAAAATAVYGTAIVPLTTMYESLQPHKFDLMMDVLNLMFVLS